MINSTHGNGVDNMCSIIFFLLICHCTLNYGDLRVDPLVSTKVGLIRGLQATDGNYSMFLGIPYGEVDKNNPFGPAAPQRHFDDVFEAYDDTVVCPQLLRGSAGIAGTLDCLQLSVFVPNSASVSNPLPVMIWIFGGGYNKGFFGKSDHGPKFLVRHDVILVTLNYRLGPYGFMCLNIPELPGNEGLKDQLLALRWIKDNIASFGGDDENMTLFGESAGATSVDLHFRFNKEKLFDKIIVQSGSASTPWGITEPDLEYSIKLAKELGYETDNIISSLNFLSTVDPLDLIAANLKADTVLRPCPEIKFTGVETFITDYAINIKIERAKTTPILLGFNDEEWLGAFYTIDEESFKNVDEFNDNLNMSFNFTAEEQAELIKVIQHFYIGDNEISKAQEVGIAEFASDFLFIHPIVRSIPEYFKDGASKIYHYMFTYYGERNFYKVGVNYTGGGAFHADELGYLFDYQLLSSEISERDQIMIDRMTTLWTNFAKYGDPTPSVTDLLPVKWPVATSSTLHYMRLDAELSLHTRPFQERMAFWDLFYEMNREKRFGYRADAR